MSVLETIKAAIYTTLGALACFVVMTGFYEGVPLVKDIPYIGSIPVIGQLATGRVAIESAKAATDARAGFVALSEKTALEAQLAKERQNALLASQLYDEAQRRATAAEQANRISHEQNEETIRSDTAPGSSWTADDDKWVRDHRAKAN